MGPIRIGVVVDWSRSGRGNQWVNLLGEIKQRGSLKQDIALTLYPLADLIVKAPSDPQARSNAVRTQRTGAVATKAESLQSIGDEHVLVINWDAMNGDPDFGAHLALQWLEHRSPELICWVERGNILIIESQAVLGIPSQRAYDALTGKGELPVSTLAEGSPGFRSKIGRRCRKTKNYPSGHGFGSVANLLEVAHEWPKCQMFPSTSTKLLINQLRGVDWNNVLYRGWFRRKAPWARRLPWMSLLETADRQMFRNHSTLQVARIGDGAIFASTMMLATTGQSQLVEAMVRCSGGQTFHLPSPRPIADWFRRGWKLAVPVLLAGIGITTVERLPHWISSWITGWMTYWVGLLGKDRGEVLFHALLVAGVVLAFNILIVVMLRAARLAREVIGY